MCQDQLHHFSFQHLVMNSVAGVKAQPRHTTFAHILLQQQPAPAFFFQFLALFGDCGSSTAEEELHRQNSYIPQFSILTETFQSTWSSLTLPFPSPVAGWKGELEAQKVEIMG